MKLRARHAMVAALFSTLVALAIAEIVLRLASQHGLYLFDIEMWRYAQQIKHETSWPGMVEEHSPNVEALLMGVRIRTDSHGFRLPDPATEKARKPDNTVIIALGDSVTLGWGVPEGMTYSDDLERALNDPARKSRGTGVTVFNAGIGNSNTSMELARYQRDIRPLHPQCLILGFFINDAEPDPVPNQSLLLRNSAILALFSGQLKVRAGDKYKSYESYYASLYRSDSSGWNRLQRVIEDFGYLLKEDHVPALILLLPEMHEPKNFGPFKQIYDRVAAIAEPAGFEVIDGSRDFPPGSGSRYWVTGDDAHPNADAQALFARALLGSRYLLEYN